MRILLLGSGGREHAIGWKLAQSPLLEELVSMPGNPGLATLGPLGAGDAANPADVVRQAEAHRIDLVVVGPEAPLAAGVVDALRDAGIAAFGPDRSGARLESSKAFAKQIMAKAGVPTGGAETFTDAAAAGSYLASLEPPYVVKADGLAAGKGVLVTESLQDANEWVHRCLGGGFGGAGATVVIEEYLSGREVSIIAVCDGTRAIPLAPARDYKRLGDGDAGPNTGGMGCFSPVDDLPSGLVDWTMDHVIEPVMKTMDAGGTSFRGFLYAGLMLTADGPKVLEFNCRLGDPETQVVLPRLQTDLLPLLVAAAEGDLPPEPPTWSDDAAVDVVLASRGYPEAPEKGHRITGIDAAEAMGATVFQAGTKRDDDHLVTSGGRVLNVVGRGGTLADARALAYAAAEKINFDGKTYRSDIARTEY